MTKLLSIFFRIIPGLMLLACGSCQFNGPQALPFPGQKQDDIFLSIESAAGPRGEVKISGQTNLPPRTQLTALALRYLVPAEPIATGAEPTFAILDYQTTRVKAGSWDARLNLWQVAEDGRYQEAWQLQSERLDLVVQPDETVHFVITLAPQQFLTTLQHRALRDGERIPAELIRTTSNGEAMLWADVSQTLGLPEGKTTPPDDRLQAQNGGWGERYRLIPEPPLPYTLTPEDSRKTTAPPQSGEFLY